MTASKQKSTVSLSQLASILNLSKTRTHQLVTDGVIPAAEDGRFDPLTAAVAALDYFRRDEQQKQARLKLLQASAANHERRLRRQIRHLITLEELGAIFDVQFDCASAMVQRESSVFHDSMAKRLPDQDARVAAFAVFNEMRRLLLGFRKGCADLLEELRNERLVDGERIEIAYQQILEAVNRTQDDELEAAPQ